MPVRIVYYEEAVDSGELTLVPVAQLRAATDRIKQNPSCGKALSGLLAGCRSVRVGGSENRLVYRQVGSDLVHVIALGRRRDNEVYAIAAARR